MDIVLASAGIVITLPLVLVLFPTLWITMGRPILYRQYRPGLNARPFRILKFRTMTTATDAAGNPLADEQRLTKLGRFLRRTSLDELPELLNVLKGDMSIVGPRPLLMEYLPLYTANQARRHEVRPGLTGWAQINGRNAISWPDKLDLDVWYVDNQSIGLDLLIMWRSVRLVASGKGVAQPGHATADRFRGPAS